MVKVVDCPWQNFGYFSQSSIYILFWPHVICMTLRNLLKFIIIQLFVKQELILTIPKFVRTNHVVTCKMPYVVVGI